MDAPAIIASTFVRHVELHDKLPSTNDRAIQLAASPTLELPALVVARLQTAGRGRGTHRWWSADGALTFSLLLDTTAWSITQRGWPQLSLATAAAACEALRCEAPALRLTIKPPNDVLLDGRKIAGILLESPGGPAPAKDRLIIGVGINVNNSWRDAPSEAGNGTALCDATARSHSGLAILTAFLRALNHQFQQQQRAMQAVR